MNAVIYSESLSNPICTGRENLYLYRQCTCLIQIWHYSWKCVYFIANYINVSIRGWCTANFSGFSFFFYWSSALPRFQRNSKIQERNKINIAIQMTIMPQKTKQQQQLLQTTTTNNTQQQQTYDNKQTNNNKPHELNNHKKQHVSLPLFVAFPFTLEQRLLNPSFCMGKYTVSKV